ncbi:membrane-associated progesterone receptor component 1 [Drosophila montana]|uniref:membrane-associated progesterone receptor component 1 n=1 Tax=Drosophila montana TaxID=40370 RepID=UPI00313C66DA
MSSIQSNTWSEQLREVISSPLGIVAMTCFVGYMAYTHIRREYPTYDDEDYEKEGHVKIPPPLENLTLTREKLEQYDAKNANGRYLVALLGTIYDVSSAPHDFGPNGSYEALAGTDIMWYIRNTARFEARDFNSYLNEWKNMLEDHFYAAGVLITDSNNDVSDSDEGTVYDSANDKDEYTEFKVEGNDGEEEELTATVYEGSINMDVEDIDKTIIDWTEGDKTILAM